MVAGWPIEETRSAICFVGRDLATEVKTYLENTEIAKAVDNYNCGGLMKIGAEALGFFSVFLMLARSLSLISRKNE